MIDDTSLEILTILQKKARIPNIEVSRRIGLAPSAVLERIRKMEKRGIIEGYEVRLNPELFDRGLIAFITAKTAAAAVQSVGAQLAKMIEVQEIHYISGEDSYLIKIRTKDTRSLGCLLCEKIQSIPGVISTKTSTVLSTVKETSRIPLKPLS
ncbi:MAG: Lrp/AsnC family transcriptional regulator [Deltaproteobacteria bacterium]|nr:Lrp/AsnC family transcriptional regulator [Deltaproteobacteria bacterium]MBW2658610.1 Lrp/AsnC family transcriptional regulator [Deltaproteobacteria bacterium]